MQINTSTPHDDKDNLLPVLIIGAGPTGLSLALSLTYKGVKCRIVEKGSAPHNLMESRALAVHSRTLELLASLSPNSDSKVVEQMLKNGYQNYGVRFTGNGTVLTELTLHDLKKHTKFPFVLSIPQAQTEQILEEELKRCSVFVERDTSVLEVEQLENGSITTSISHAGKEEKVTSQYLVGCDGAHSIIRKKINASFDGERFPGQFHLVDAVVEADDNSLEIGDKFLAGILPLPHSMRPDLELSSTQRYCRILVTEFEDNVREGHNSPDAVEHGIVESAEKLPLSFFQNFITQVSPTVKLQDARWSTSFCISHRLASHFRRGNVFIAGDAAHIHSPAGGQGLNTSIQDALNLSWKLILAENIRRSNAQDAESKTEKILSSYESERIANAKSVLKATHKTMQLKSSLQQKVRNSIMYYFSSFKGVQEKLRENLSQLKVSYTDLKSTLLSNLSLGVQANGLRAPNALLADGQTLYDELSKVTSAGKLVLILLSPLPIASQQTWTKTYNEAERVALQVKYRYSQYVDVLFVFPHSEQKLEQKIAWKDAYVFDSKGHQEETLGGVYENYNPNFQSRGGDQSWVGYLIRPDLYIALSSQDADSILSFLDSFL